MHFLFFDTETTGLPRQWKAPVEDLDNWPRMIQLAWLLYDEDGNEIIRSNDIVKPEGFRIPKAASAIHGITTEKAMEEGVELGDVLRKFTYALDGADYLVAHNIEFDDKIVGAELLRKEMHSDFFTHKRICTMKSSIRLRGLPPLPAPDGIGGQPNEERQRGQQHIVEPLARRVARVGGRAARVAHPGAPGVGLGGQCPNNRRSGPGADDGRVPGALVSALQCRDPGADRLDGQWRAAGRPSDHGCAHRGVEERGQLPTRRMAGRPWLAVAGAGGRIIRRRWRGNGGRGIRRDRVAVPRHHRCGRAGEGPCDRRADHR